MKGASDRVGRVHGRFNIRIAFKPCQTPSQTVKKPKGRPQDHQRRGIIYKVKCNDCPFTYIGESKRSWSSRGPEHDPGRAFNGEGGGGGGGGGVAETGKHFAQSIFHFFRSYINMLKGVF